MSDIPISTSSSPSVVLDLIYRMKVRDVMKTDLLTAKRETTLRHIKVVMKEKGVTGVPIVEQARLLGIISMDDIINALDGGYIDDRAELHMSRNLIVLEEEMPLSLAISQMEKHSFGRYPVINKGKELVGIITSRDIIAGLLVAINQEVEKLERRIEAPEPAAEGPAELRFATRKYDFENAGRASTEIKKLLVKRELDPRLIRRIAVAAYELEMNQVVHSEGGTIRFFLDGQRAEIVAEDCGPGIANVEQALQEGYSTANEWIRSMGFGAGMGLPNSRRVSDSFEITSSPGKGTTVRAVMNVPQGGVE